MLYQIQYSVDLLTVDDEDEQESKKVNTCDLVWEVSMVYLINVFQTEGAHALSLGNVPIGSNFCGWHFALVVKVSPATKTHSPNMLHSQKDIKFLYPIMPTAPHLNLQSQEVYSSYVDRINFKVLLDGNTIVNPQGIF